MREKGQVGTWGEFWDAYRKYGIKAGLKRRTTVISSWKIWKNIK